MRKLFTLILLTTAAVQAQNPNSAKFPTAVATDQDLLVAANGLNSPPTTLNGSITNSSTSIVLVDASRYNTPTMITIESETIKICSKSSNTLTVCTGGRGYRGSAAPHTSGVAVFGLIDQDFHNQIAAEIRAVELNSLGTYSTRYYGSLQATLDAASAFSVVKVSASLTLSSTATITKSVLLECAPGITLTATGIPGDVIAIASDRVTIRGCGISAGTATSAIANSGTRSNILIDHNEITGSAYPIAFSSGSDIIISNNSVSAFAGTGIGTGTSVAVSRVRISGNNVDSSTETLLNGGGIGVWGSHTVIDRNVVRIGGNQDQGIVALNNPGAGLTDVVISNNSIEVVASGAFECYGVGSLTDFTITGNTCRATVSPAPASSFYGFEINQSSRGTVTGNTFFGNNPSVPTAGILLLSSSSVTVMGNQVSGWGSASGSVAVALTLTDNSNPASGRLSNNSVSANTLVQTAAGSTASVIQVESLVTGYVLNNDISNNVIQGAYQSGQSCVLVNNSASATMVGNRFAGNTINNCGTGITLTGGQSTFLDSNKINNVVTALYSDGGSYTTIIDHNASGVPFSFLASQQNGSQLFCNNCNSTCTGTGPGRNCLRESNSWTH